MDSKNSISVESKAESANAGFKVNAVKLQQRPKQEPVFGEIPKTPTQEAPEGIRFDYCNGLRVAFPKTGDYRLVFKDSSTGTCVYNMDVKPGAIVESVKKFFIPFEFEIYHKGEETPFFKHVFNAQGKEVMIQLPIGTLGDTIAWFSYVERFQKKHSCKIVCSMAPKIADIWRKQYPYITFIDKPETANYQPYACYCLGLFFQGDTDHQPYDFRYVGLHKTAGHILGLETPEELADLPPRVDLTAPRQIKEPYVCIAAKASSQPKMWNNPQGWREVVKFLKDAGYRVLCIDKTQEEGFETTWNYMPFGAEDYTGDKDLQERINLIKDADFFIGLSSGLSWLAWLCKVPVVMISGFTEPTNEFFTPYRVINTQVCHGCWNDTRREFNHFDYLWCPVFSEAGKKFECTRAITGEQVIRMIQRIPEFQARKGNR